MTFDRVSVHDASPQEVIDAIGKHAAVDDQQREYPTNLRFPALDVNLYREHSDVDKFDTIGISVQSRSIVSRRTRRSTRAADWTYFEIKGSWPPPGYLGRLPLGVARDMMFDHEKNRTWEVSMLSVDWRLRHKFLVSAGFGLLALVSGCGSENTRPNVRTTSGQQMVFTSNPPLGRRWDAFACG